jgi:two-component system sensor histidine kinase UhpB
MNGLAGIYINLANYTEATKYILASLKLKEELGDKMGIAGCYNSIGSICDRQGNYTEALKSHFISLKIREGIGDKQGVGYSYNNIGYCFEKQGNYSEALKYHLLAIKIREEIGDKVGLADSYYNLGQAYIGLNNFPEAKQLFTEGLSLSQKIGTKEIIKKCYEGLAKIDSASGNWQEAYHNHKLFILYRDSLVNEENNKKMVQTAMQYEFDKKADSLKYNQTLTEERLKREMLIAEQQQQSLLVQEKEVALIRNEKKLQELEIQKTRTDYSLQKADGDKRQQQMVILNNERELQMLQLKKQDLLKKYLLTALALFVILSFFIYNNFRTRQKLKLQSLRNKIATDLHDDVGSTLSSISIFSQMAQQQSKEIIPLLETIENSSRQMLDAMADIVWTINPENDHFEKIILRMKSFAFELLGATKIDFEFIADENIAKMKIPMNVRKNLFLIFKEATNNMVKYSRADKAMFTVKGEKNKLMLVISDNGKGFNVRQDTEGNGLKNMKKRAQEIDGQLFINSEPGKGTSVQLNVAV